MSPARGSIPSAGVIKEDLRLVIFAWVGYNYDAQVAAPVVVTSAKLHTAPGSSLYRDPDKSLGR
jgi:hypothetical protein